jgi:corrinoid protein of di/trimethylamine methyltransferase
MKLSAILDKIYDAVLECNTDAVSQLANLAVQQKIDPMSVLDRLNAAIKSVGDKFGRGEAFITDLVGSAEAMKAGMRIIEPLILESKASLKTSGRITMATAEGDIHDIGKNIVITLARAAGFEVADLGVDVPVETIVDAVRQSKPHVVGISALLTSTISAQERLIRRLRELNLRDAVKVTVGGAAVSREWSERIGADGYAPDGLTAVELMKEVVGTKDLA